MDSDKITDGQNRGLKDEISWKQTMKNKDVLKKLKTEKTSKYHHKKG